MQFACLSLSMKEAAWFTILMQVQTEDALPVEARVVVRGNFFQ
jgi:hypothetical protein